MSVWVWMIAGGLLTYGIRLSFILLFGKFDIPEGVKRALRLVPAAVLSAIVFQEVLMPGGELNLSLGNLRLISAVLAALVAWKTHNVVLTVAVGMGALWLFQFALGW